jgi:hypothetical protein
VLIIITKKRLKIKGSLYTNGIMLLFLKIHGLLQTTNLFNVRRLTEGGFKGE